jgi:acyl-CoA dehydrogenase
MAHALRRCRNDKAIAEFQNTKFKLAELATKTHIARVFVDDVIAKVVSGTLDTVTASMANIYGSTNEIMKELISRAL